MIPHREPEVLERLNKANHHERRFVVGKLVREEELKDGVNVIGRQTELDPQFW